jgi:hypothetical protein
MTIPPSSAGSKELNEPPKLPIAERTALKTTTSRLILIPFLFASFEASLIS